MTPTQSTTREQRAQTLIDSGAVTLLIGTGTAEVRGNRGITYIVTKDGCCCPDRTRRGATCYHEMAVRQLCAEYRALKAATERGERVRPSTALLRAIRWPEKPKAKAGCQQCGAVTDFDLCSGCFFGQRPETPETPGSAFPLNLPEVA